MGTHDRLGRRGRNTKRGTWKPVRETKHGDMTKTEREIQERESRGHGERGGARHKEIHGDKTVRTR